jgi:hypothetical protein
MKRKIVSICVSMGLLATIVPVIASANGNLGNVIVVDDEGDGDYTSIQEAIDSAYPGDIIKVYSGTYDDTRTPDSIIVDKSVVIEGIAEELGRGDDTGKPVVDGHNGVKMTIFETDSVTITGFILGSLTIYHSSNITISDNVLNSIQDHGGEEGIIIIGGQNILIARNALRNHAPALYINAETRSNITITQNNFMNNIRHTKFIISGLLSGTKSYPAENSIVFTENYWGADYIFWKEDHSYNWRWGFIQYTLFYIFFCHKPMYNFFPNLPKPIFGKIQLFDDKSSYDISLPWILFDKNPAQEPYII